MCDACLIRTVARSLDWREMLEPRQPRLRSSLSAKPAAAQAVRSAPVSRVLDLTHTLRPNFPTYPGTPAFEQERKLTFEKDGYNLNRLTYEEHVGTHFDAPIRFLRMGSRWMRSRSRTSSALSSCWTCGRRLPPTPITS